MPRSLSTDALVPIVTIGGQIRADLRCVAVQQSMGGARPDYAVLEYAYSNGRQVGPVVVNRQIIDEQLLGICEVTLPTVPPVRIHKGLACEQRWAIDADGVERLQVISRVEAGFIGYVITTAYYTDEGGAQLNLFAASSWPLLFNPTIDGNAFANRANGALIHPDSVRRTVGPLSATRTFWNLPEIVVLLTGEAKDEFEAPTKDEVSVVTGTDRSIVRDLEIPLGTPMARALDMALEPYGFTWRIDYAAAGNPKIKVERRGGFAVADIGLQPAGQPLDIRSSEVISANIRADVTDRSANRVLVKGSERLVEATFELIPAWHPQYDDTPRSQLGINSDYVKATPALDRVWRDWVLNETGEYHEMRPGRSDVDVVKLLTGEDTPRRRFRLLPCISQKPDATPWGEASGVYVKITLDGGQTWHPISELPHNDDMSYEILDKEAGIRFNAYSGPPLAFFKNTPPISYVSVQVTATIPCVWPVLGIKNGFAQDTYSFPFAGGGPGLSDLTAYVRAPGFHLREVHPVKSQLVGQPNTAVDDTENAKALADKIYDNVRQATVEGDIVLNGVDRPPNDYWGRAVASIAGRSVRMHTTPDQSKAPLIAGLSYDFQQQELTLTLDTVRDA
jgi:hypothetical protein